MLGLCWLVSWLVGGFVKRRKSNDGLLHDAVHEVKRGCVHWPLVDVLITLHADTVAAVSDLGESPCLIYAHQHTTPAAAQKASLFSR